ncbi:MAG: Phosphonate ABC transporter phosphate-binding periplasmic component [Candidatus Rifleibacterium amylolyticum]|nr:MAG: Phosphonate ABC transporter phosphate-binding periplasmic component [Candidatus Rifleibacterium amylolyticum]NLF97016.1 phosphate/phosphite/phosphonate ABC transporter substrate-binding protein [Candidatus Riflebacteria bacterium]
MGKKTVIAFLLVAFAVTMLLHGCGGSDKDKPATDKPPQGDVKPAQTASSGEPASSSPYANTVLKLGRIPFTNSTAMVHKHNKFLEYLTRKLGVKQVRLQTASNYTEIMNLLIEGKIDIAWLATMTSVEARKNPEIELLVKPIRFGTTSYRGIIIARQDSGIRNLKDLKGKKFAWVEPESASGYIFPKALLLEAGINTDKDFADETAFLNKHDAVVLNVLLGKYDAGACYDDARNTLREKAKMDELTILATTQDISNEPIVVRKSLPPDLIEKIKSALLELNVKNPEGKEILDDLTDVQGFLPAKDTDYDYIEKVQKLLEEHSKP